MSYDILRTGDTTSSRRVLQIYDRLYAQVARTQHYGGPLVFNCDKMQDIRLTPDKVLKSLVYGSPFCIIIYTSYKLSKMVGFFMA